MPVDNSFAEKMAEKEQPGKKRRILRRLVLTGLCLLPLVIVVIACLVTFAPNLFSPLVLGGIRKQGLDVEAVEIRKLGFGQTVLVLTGLNLGKVRASTLPVRLDYELGELIKSKRVRSIDIHHAVLSCNLEAGSEKEPFDFKDLPELLFQGFPDDLPFEKVSIKDASMEFHLGSNLEPTYHQVFQAVFLAKGNLKLECVDFKVLATFDAETHHAEIQLDVNTQDLLQWLELVGERPDKLKDIGSFNANAFVLIEEARFNEVEGTIQIDSLNTKLGRAKNLKVSAKLAKELVPQQLKASADLHDLKFSGIEIDPLHADADWNESGKLQALIGITRILKKGTVDATVDKGTFTAQLDKNHQPRTWHWTGSHSKIQINKNDTGVLLREVTLSKDYDGRQLTVDLLAQSGEIDDLPFGKFKLAAEASENLLELQGELQFSGLEIPFKAEGHTELLAPVLEAATLTGKPDTDTIEFEAILESLGVSVGPVELEESPILNTLPTGLPESTISGIFQLTGTLTDETFELKVTDASIHFPEHNLTVSGVNTLVKFSLDGGLHTIEDANIAIATIRANQLELRNGSLPVALLPGNIVRTLGGEFEALGGKIGLGPTTLQPNGYDTLTTGILHLENIDFHELLALTETPPLELQGHFGGQLPFSYERHEIHLQSGHLRMNSGTHGRLKYNANGQFTRNLDPGTQQFKRMQLAERALLELDLSEMELELFLDDESGAPLPARATIKGTYEEKNSKINLNLTLNLRGEVEMILRNAAKGKLDLSIGF